MPRFFLIDRRFLLEKPNTAPDSAGSLRLEAGVPITGVAEEKTEGITRGHKRADYHGNKELRRRGCVRPISGRETDRRGEDRQAGALNHTLVLFKLGIQATFFLQLIDEKIDVVKSRVWFLLTGTGSRLFGRANAAK